MKATFFASCLAAIGYGLSLETQVVTQSELLGTYFIKNEDPKSCKMVSDRNKSSLYDFEMIQASREKFKDKLFKRDVTSFYWSGEYFDDTDLPSKSQLRDAEWIRLSEKYPDSKLFGSENIRPQDVKQGQIGNCWFLSAAAAIAEHSGRMEEVFAKNYIIKAQGAYVLNLYTLGVPHSVVVDDYIPFINDKPMGAQMANDGSLWPLILEKAFAKVRGNYLHISGGKASSGVRYMRGGPVTERETTYMTPDQIWDFISSHLSNGDLLTAGTKHGKDTHTDDWGIVKGHAYTIAGVKVLSDGTKLIRARNPWGKDSYMGDFGATSELWTDSFIDEVPDAKNADDGYIYLPIKQFKVSFSYLFANHNAEKMHIDWYMKFDDKPALEAGPDEIFNKMADTCSDNCIYHEMVVVSTVAQKIWVSLNTYNGDTMPVSCKTGLDDFQNMLYPNLEEDIAVGDLTSGGTLQVGPFNFDGNAYMKFQVGLSLSEGKIPKDWSLVAWGDSGPVYVYNSDGSTTSNFAMSGQHQKHAPQNKPLHPFESDPKVNDLPQQKPLKKVVVPDPDVPKPKVFDPKEDYEKWAAKQNAKPDKEGKALVQAKRKNKEGSWGDVYKNQSTKKQKVTLSLVAHKKDWATIQHMHVKNFNFITDWKAEQHPEHSWLHSIEIKLQPGAEIGWLLKPDYRDAEMVGEPKWKRA